MEDSFRKDLLYHILRGIAWTNVKGKRYEIINTPWEALIEYRRIAYPDFFKSV